MQPEKPVEMCCAGLRPREGCTYHDPKLQPGYVAGGFTAPERAARPTPKVPSSWRLLGKDDPEVSDDWIYATPGGGLASVPADADAC